jgi:transposase
MRKTRDVLRLSLGEGLSLRQIAASLQVPFTTAGEHVRRAKAAGLSWPLPDDLDDDRLEALLFPAAAPPGTERVAPDWQHIHAELHRPHVTLMLLWVEYREADPDGYGYSQFCEHYRRWRRHLDAVMRQNHKAGEKCFVDFPGATIPIYDVRSGEVAFDAELFVAALGCSGYLFAEAVRSQELPHWVSAHVHALEFFAGCPAILVCDNLKSGVTKARRYEPDVNATYQEMAAHYQMAIIPARSYKPRDKAKAEGGVLLAERWIMARLRNRRFTSLGEANEAIGELVGAINDRPFKKLPGSRRSVYEDLDRPALRPLPAKRYEFATWRRAKVSVDYHIEIRADRHYYSVPHRLIGEYVDVRTSAATIEVFHRHRRVASHLRQHGPGYTTEPTHMPEGHRRHAEWTPDRIISWAGKTGPAVAKLAEAVIASRPHPEQGYRSCLGIIRLADRYGPQRLDAACARALAVRSYSYRSVESILRNGLDARPLPPDGPGPSHPTHANVRGANYYQ